MTGNIQAADIGWAYEERCCKDKYWNVLTVTQWFYDWRRKNAWIGSRKFCNQITRKQLLVNTKVKEHSVDTEQNERGMTGDFLTLVTEDQRHEYLTCCYQMKSVKVWQISLKLDEQSLFKSRILQCQLSLNDSCSQLPSWSLQLVIWLLQDEDTNQPQHEIHLSVSIWYYRY